VNRHLIVKLLAINLVVIAFVMIVVWFSIDTLAAGYFVTLMEKYHISPGPAHSMFVGAVHRYLLWACLAAVILAAALSFFLMHRVLSPLTRMTRITRDIAAGNFGVRVPPGSADEVGQLAQAFNRMAASLEKIERLRRNLMVDVAHELRTPLTNIRGYLEAIADGVLNPSADTVALLQAESLRLVQLVEDVLQLARADAAAGHLRLEPVDLQKEVRSSLEAAGNALGEKSIRVNVHASRNLPPVQAERERLARVLRNLTDNAARYTPVGGTVDIRIDPAPGKVCVAYENDGGELVPDDLPFLFERFYRGEKSRSRTHGGAGIGLAIVKELVEAHGGRVGAEAAGGRVRIWFELPTDPPGPAD